MACFAASKKRDAADKEKEEVETLAQFKYLPMCSFSMPLHVFEFKSVRVAAAAAPTPEKDTAPLKEIVD